MCMPALHAAQRATPSDPHPPAHRRGKSVSNAAVLKEEKKLMIALYREVAMWITSYPALQKIKKVRYNGEVVNISFLKKLVPPKFSMKFLGSKPSSVVGINIGSVSTKVVQLRYESERAILETYGELKNEGYLKTTDSISQGGALHYLDKDIASLLQDVLRESNVTARDGIFSIPASAAFLTSMSFPRSLEREIAAAVPYEARKYVPIPIAEVAFEWMILDSGEPRDEIDVLLVAVPKEVVEKVARVAELAGVKVLALEVEPFSMVRSLVGRDNTPTAIINFGHQSTTVAFVDRGVLRIAHTIGRGSQELTRALERGLGVAADRAEVVKRDVGISERIEEREITSVIAPIMETLFAEIDRLISLYNRKAERKIQKVNLTGGGADLKGIVEYAASKFGVEVTRGNPFSRVVTPAFMAPLLRDIGPSFSIAVGLALREITTR